MTVDRQYKYCHLSTSLIPDLVNKNNRGKDQRNAVGYAYGEIAASAKPYISHNKVPVVKTVYMDRDMPDVSLFLWF